MKKGLILYPKVDKSQTRNQNRDEVYFRWLARHFKKAHPEMTIHLEEFDEDDSAEFFSDMQKPAYQALDFFAYIGHGGTDVLYSANIGGSTGANQLSTRLNAACNNGAVIILYACNCGSLNNSLLRRIYNETISKNFKLYGHASAGRAGPNPDKTVFPPSNGAKLIDEVLGELASAPRFRSAWNSAMQNEVSNLWARFFLLSNDELLRRACRVQLRKAKMRNRMWRRTLGWQTELERIRVLVGVSKPGGVELAIGIARWQAQNFDDKNKVDGILGPKSWTLMESQL